jgi:hypothetical protein
MTRLAPSCRVNRQNSVWKQTSGVAKEVYLPAVGAVDLTFTGQGVQLLGSPNP